MQGQIRSYCSVAVGISSYCFMGAWAFALSTRMDARQVFGDPIRDDMNFVYNISNIALQLEKHVF